MRRSWAVGRTMLREAGRSQSFRLFCLLFVVVLVASPRPEIGDLLSRLRFAATYGVSWPVIAVSLVTLALSASAVREEIERRTIELVVTKPVRPSTVLLGKLLGSFTVAASLLLVVFLSFSFELWRMTRGDLRHGELTAARERFFTPRVGVVPDPPPVNEEEVRKRVERRIAALAAEPTSRGGEVSIDRGAIEERERRFLERRHLAPGESAAFTFRDIPSGADGEALQLRYKLHVSPPDAAIDVETRWRAGGETVLSGTSRQSAWQTREVPASIIRRDGSAKLTLENAEPPGSGFEIIVLPGNVELLGGYGSFAGSLVRSFLLLASQLLFLAALGVFAAAFFSLPTACLLVFFVYVAGIFSGFLKESLDLVAEEGGIFVSIERAILELLPDLGSENPIELLIDGRALTVKSFLGEASWNVFVRAGVVLLVAAVYWNHREPGEGARWRLS